MGNYENFFTIVTLVCVRRRRILEIEGKCDTDENSRISSVSINFVEKWLVVAMYFY